MDGWDLLTSVDISLVLLVFTVMTCLSLDEIASQGPAGSLWLPLNTRLKWDLLGSVFISGY